MSTQIRIKESAREIFAIKGYDGTSVGDIARLVNIKTPSLYSHFSSKEEIFMVLVSEALQDYTHYMKAAILKTVGQSLEERLFSYFKDFVAYFYKDVTKSNFLKMLLLFPPSHFAVTIKEMIADVEKVLIPHLIEVFQDGVANNENSLKYLNLVTAYFSFIGGYVIGVASLSTELNMIQLNEVWSVFWNGFKNHI